MELQEIRIQIDALAQETKWLGLIKCSDRLYFAKAWTGKLMGELGGESPYKNDGKRESVSDIEPTDSVADTSAMGHAGNLIAKIDGLRQSIQTIVDGITTIKLTTEAVTVSLREVAICRTNVYNYLCEAKFELGFELQKIRENA